MIDTTHGQILEVLPGANAPNTPPTSYQDRLGIWQSGQWSFSSLPPGFRAMVYDGAPDRQEVIAIGQQAQPSQTTVPLYSDRAWKWDGKAWQPLQDGTPDTLSGPTWLVYNPSTNNVDLISYGAGALEPVNAPGYVHAQLGDQGNWKVLQCGAWVDPFDGRWQSCGLPNVAVPTMSYQDTLAVTYGHVIMLGYDPRLGTTLFYGSHASACPKCGASSCTSSNGTGATTLELNSNGCFQPVSLGASNLPAGSWAGTFAFLDHTLWIAGYSSDGSFHLYRDDGGGFRAVVSTATPPSSPVPPQAFAESSDATIQANLLYGQILPYLWNSNLVYDPSSQQLIWLQFGNPKWTRWIRCRVNDPNPSQSCAECVRAGYCPGPPDGEVALQATAWTLSTVSDQPKEPCTRVAIENGRNGGLTLLAPSLAEQSSIEKSLRSDGLFNVTATSLTGLGLEVIQGFKLSSGDVSAKDITDLAFHLDFRNDQRTYWFNEGDATAAINFANEWGSVTPQDQALWNSRLDLNSQPIGFDVSGYQGQGLEIGGKGVDSNLGANGVVWVATSTDPHTGDTSQQGILDLSGFAGATQSVFSAVIDGNAVATVTYTVDRNKKPKQFSIEVDAGLSATLSVGVSPEQWFRKQYGTSPDQWFSKDLGSVSAGIDLNGGFMIKSTLNLNLTNPANQSLVGHFSQSMTKASSLDQKVTDIIHQSELLITIDQETKTTPGVEVKFGFQFEEFHFSFGYEWGSEALNTKLIAAGYATVDQGIQEWTDCEYGTTHAADENS